MGIVLIIVGMYLIVHGYVFLGIVLLFAGIWE